MPHIIVKLVAGKSEQQKSRLTEAITEDVVSVLDYGEEAVSIAFEEVPPEEWADRVYRPNILANLASLYKKPGYTL